MSNVSVKGIRLSDGRKVQLLVADEPKKSDGTDLLSTDLGAANGIATLDGSSLVVQEPASTSVGAAADSIVKRDVNADVLVPNTPTSVNAAASKIYVKLPRSWKVNRWPTEFACWWFRVQKRFAIKLRRSVLIASSTKRGPSGAMPVAACVWP